MRTLLLIMRNFLTLTFNKKGNYLLFFAAPVASFLLFTFIFGTTMTSGLSIGYVNKDKGHIGTDLITWLQRTGKNKVTRVAEDQLEKNSFDGTIAMSLVIPGDFSGEIEHEGKPAVIVSSLPGEAAGGFIQGEINYFINSVMKLKQISGRDNQKFHVMYEDFLHNTYTMKTREVNDTTISKTSGLMGFGYFLFLILVQATVITGLMLKEKQNRTFFRIRVAPVPEILYSLGNMLASFIILSVQIIITLLTILFIFRLNLGVSLFTALPLLLAFCIPAIGFGILITAFAGSTLQAALIGNLIIVPSSMLSGCFWPLSLMPEFLQYIAGIFPQSWVVRAIENLQNGAGVSSIGFTMLLLLAFGALFISIYAYKMKYSKDIKTIT